MDKAKRPMPEWINTLGLTTITQEDWDWIEDLAETFPPFTEAQCDRLRLIFRGA